MSGRELKIFLLTHLYPIYIVLNLQYWLGEVVFNSVPPILVCLLLYQLASTNLKLNSNEKRSIYFMVIFTAFTQLYYLICISAIRNPIKGIVWIRQHNIYTFTFIIFRD